MRAAATAESTPPDMAASTRMPPILTGGGVGLPGTGDRPGQHLGQPRDVGAGRRVAEREPQGRGRVVGTAPHGEEDLAGLVDAGTAGGADGGVDAVLVEEEQHVVGAGAG